MLTIRYLIEYAGMRIGLLVIDALPLSACIAVARGLASIWYLINGSRRNIAQSNILRSGITSDPHEAARIAKKSFQHFAILVVESLKSGPVFREDNWRDKTTVDIPPETMAILNDPNQGMILASGHFGNWEIAAQLLSHMKPVVGITRSMNNPYTNTLMENRKPRNRFTLTPKHDANSVRFISTLKDGKILALLMDQHASRAGMMVDFFGSPASTHTSPAMLHLITGAPICFGYCLRTGPMSFTLRASPPLDYARTGDRKKDTRAILEMLNSHLEAVIREHPEQYLWAHRRWRK